LVEQWRVGIHRQGPPEWKGGSRIERASPSQDNEQTSRLIPFRPQSTFRSAANNKRTKQSKKWGPEYLLGKPVPLYLTHRILNSQGYPVESNGWGGPTIFGGQNGKPNEKKTQGEGKNVLLRGVGDPKVEKRRCVHRSEETGLIKKGIGP